MLASLIPPRSRLVRERRAIEAFSRRFVSPLSSKAGHLYQSLNAGQRHMGAVPKDAASRAMLALPAGGTAKRQASAPPAGARHQQQRQCQPDSCSCEPPLVLPRRRGPVATAAVGSRAPRAAAPQLLLPRPLVLLLALLAAAAPPPAAAQQQAPLKGSGIPNNATTDVYISCLLERLLHVNAQEYTHTTMLYFYITWVDPEAHALLLDNTERMRNGSERPSRLPARLALP